MPVLNFDDEKEVKEYNDYLNNYGIVSFMQDLRWGLVKDNWIRKAIYLKKDNKICAAMMILIEKLPHTKYSFMYSPRGPICDIANVELVNELINEASLIAKKYNAYTLTFDPQFVYDKNIVDLYKKNNYKVYGRKINPDGLIQPRYECKIFLEGKTEEEIKMGFASKTRYNIKLAEKHGVKVSYKNSKEYLDIFYNLYKITAIRDKIGYRSYEYFEKMLKIYDEDSLRIYVTKHDNDYLSAAICISFGNEVYYMYGASSNEKRNLMPNYLMQMEMIKWAIEKKAKIYNIAGVIHNNKNDGLFKFKFGFCREVGYQEYIGEINKVYKPFIFIVIKKALMLKKLLHKLHK